MCLNIVMVLKDVLILFVMIFVLWIVIVNIRYGNKECSQIQTTKFFWKNGSFNSSSIDSRLKLNHLKIIGTHNSYHQWNIFYRYEHRLLDQQFHYGVRQIELDIHLMKNDLLIYHLQLFDDRTNCYCLKHCFNLIANWIDANPFRYPIYLFIEIKQMFYEDLMTGLSGGVRCEHFQQIIDHLFNVFSSDMFIFPKEIQGNFSSIHLALKQQRQDELSNDYSYKNYGWPPVFKSLGKLIPVFLDDVHNVAQRLYFQCDSLKNSFLISQKRIDVPYSSIITMSDINNNVNKLIQMTNNGQMSRLLLSYGEKNLDKIYESSKGYGIHIISSDSLYCDDTSLCRILHKDFQDSTILCNDYFAPSFCSSSLSFL